MKRFILLAALLLLAPVSFLAPAAAAPPAIGGCGVLPPDNVWNTPIDTLPLDANSSAYVSTIGASAGLKADFGEGFWDGGPIGIPYVLVDGDQTKYPVEFGYDDESDPGPYAVPLDAPIEGGPDADGDRHAIAIDTDNCILYELFYAFPGPNSWDAGSGAIYDLNSHALRPESWTSADAAGLPIFPGLVRYDEVLAGEINHAIRFTAPQTRGAYIWPARHEASDLTGSQYPPMGQRFRLKASFDISGFSAENQVILRALKKYGMILADNGSSWYMSGVPDERWDNDDLHDLGDIPGSAFEAIDESSLMIDEDSGQAKQPGPAPQYGVAWGVNQTPSIMAPAATINVNLSFTNTGTWTWPTANTAHPVVASYHWKSGACPGSTMVVAGGLKTPLPADVPHGGAVSNLAAKVKAPSALGTYCLQWDLARNGFSWFSAKGAAMMTKTVTVAPPYGVAWGANNAPSSMARNATVTFNASFTNTGSMTWYTSSATPVRFSYHWLNGACTSGGTTAIQNGLRTAPPSNVLPGGSVNNLPVKVKAPPVAGTYCLRFDLVRIGITWFSDKGAAVLNKTVVIN